MNHKSKFLTIFEGCDGTGKTTAAKRYAQATGARYVHFPALPRVKKGLARMYVEAMLPALLGYQDVVFDRSWLSEVPYGIAFREGLDRLTDADRRMLERIALRCSAVVIKCETSWAKVVGSFRARKGQEMLRNEEQLKEVYNMYRKVKSHLTTVPYDFAEMMYEDLEHVISKGRVWSHPLSLQSVGNWNAKTVLVGEGFAERRDQDPFYQAPFVSFSGDGCSRWLTEQLGGISEQSLLWINSDQDLQFLQHTENEVQVIALGNVAAAELKQYGIKHEAVSHPQYQKRFHPNEPYELLNILLGD